MLLLFKLFVSFGSLGCLFAFAAFVDLTHYDSPRRLPVGLFWLGTIPLAISLALLPILLSTLRSLTKEADRRSDSLDKTVKDHFEAFRRAREAAGMEPTEISGPQYEAGISKLQAMISNSSGSAVKSMRSQALKCAAAFGVALALLLASIALRT